MTQHQFTEVISDKDFYPLPVENPDLEAKAFDLAFGILKLRESRRFDLAAADEIRLWNLVREADGTSKRTIRGVIDGLAKDMQRRLRDVKQVRVSL